MEAYHDPTDEPVCESKFDWSFNDADLPVDTWRVMMYSEILDFIKLLVWQMKTEGSEQPDLQVEQNNLDSSNGA